MVLRLACAQEVALGNPAGLVLGRHRAHQRHRPSALDPYRVRVHAWRGHCANPADPSAVRSFATTGWSCAIQVAFFSTSALLMMQRQNGPGSLANADSLGCRAASASRLLPPLPRSSRTSSSASASSPEAAKAVNALPGCVRPL